MGLFRDNRADFDLKCDFPARESFREGLLARLINMDERETNTAPSAAGPAFDDDLTARELTDEELEMLAAAQGDLFIHQNSRGGIPPFTF